MYDQKDYSERCRKERITGKGRVNSMVMISQQNTQKVLESIRNGRIDAVDVSENNLVDRIIYNMHREGVSQGLVEAFEDKRERRAIPFDITLLLAIAAKMKVHTSLTDIPFGIQDTETLAELGYCVWDSERDMATGLMDEGSIRYLVGKGSMEEWFQGYNRYFRDYLLPMQRMEANIHILDCTKIEVELKNLNYEGAGYMRDHDGEDRGYKLVTLRGIYGDAGMIEEVRFEPINTYSHRT
jgi:hypothetical protein